jgi:aspartyl aminopeptidase
MNDAIADCCAFLDAGPAPAVAAAAAADRLRAAGFAERQLAEPWRGAGGAWFVRRGAALVAWRCGATLTAFSLVGAHVDSPHLRLRPRPAHAGHGCLRLGVEVYGGILRNSWLDRDLGLAGSVIDAHGATHLVTIREPLARVPQLAVHLDRAVHDDGLKLNPQTHLVPIWGLERAGEDPAAALRAVVGAAAGIPAASITAMDLSLFDTTPAARLGRDGELLASGRLDNLVSCWAGLHAVIAAPAAPTAPVLALFDHEEVGSASDTGADGAFLGQVLERIALATGLDRAGHLAALAASGMVSADMAHAVHPNYPDRHDAHHQPRLGGGPVLKTNHNQRYATTAAGAARLRTLAHRHGIALQDFVARGDVGCGSTIGPAAAAALGIAVTDVGAPMLSMHSAREVMACADLVPYRDLLAATLVGN